MYNSVTIRSFVPRLGFVLDITFTSSFFFYEGVRSLLLTTRIVIVTVEREGGGLRLKLRYSLSLSLLRMLELGVRAWPLGFSSCP